jgi:alanine dehydrogenase
MQVGVLKEIKIEENRVCMTPAGVEIMVANGHKVLVETKAGEGSGFSDEVYLRAGAEIIETAAEIFERCEMVMHVKEPQPCEYQLIREGQLLFTYFHFAADEALTMAMIERKAVCIAYETVSGPHGDLPLLTPMSEVAGRMAAQEGAKYLERSHGGRGILMGGVTGVAPATVVILGGGIVGTHAAQMACGLGAKVYLLDMNLERLRHLDETMPKNCFPLMSSPATVRELITEADVVIGAVLLHGAKTPKLITHDMLKSMKLGAVLVDVAIDQGGCFETSRPTTHQNPVYQVEGIVHYCVANMPGSMPLTSTMALTNATLPFAVKLADRGWKQAAREDLGLKAGLNIVEGTVCYPGVAEAFGLSLVEVETILEGD